MRSLRIIVVFVLLCTYCVSCFSQDSLVSINEKKIDSIIRFLASDSLKGRGNGSPELLRAGEFIAERFQQAGLQTLPGAVSYFIQFPLFTPVPGTMPQNMWWNGSPVTNDNFLYLHRKPGYFNDRQLTDFTIQKIDTCFTAGVLNSLPAGTTPLLLWTDKLQADGKSSFPETIDIPPGGLKRDVLLVYSAVAPESLLLSASKDYYSSLGYNVVGILPGKTKPSEVIIFSSHYDHVGVNNSSRRDSIYNGANDNASGTTAVLALAEYFAERNDNERTLMFCTFAGEELGLFGSIFFSGRVVTDKIVAMINIEMIGVPQSGKNSVFITGREYSSLPRLLEKGMKAKGIRVRNDPAPASNLFMRSDNFPFARKGVPAHTIMSSDDHETCYHQSCDEINRININHLAAVIRAVAVAAQPLVDGTETPERIKKGRF
jgi:hypothetical protein